MLRLKGGDVDKILVYIACCTHLSAKGGDMHTKQCWVAEAMISKLTNGSSDMFN